jgi:hypothetical protein
VEPEHRTLALAELVPQGHHRLVGHPRSARGRHRRTRRCGRGVSAPGRLPAAACGVPAARRLRSASCAAGGLRTPSGAPGRVRAPARRHAGADRAACRDAGIPAARRP